MTVLPSHFMCQFSKKTGYRFFAILRSIKEYLNQGYLKVELAGGYAEKFMEIAVDQERQIELFHKRQERIADRAKAINLAKKLEADKEEPPE